MSHFLKNHVLGIFLLGVLASLVAAFIYALLPSQSPTPAAEHADATNTLETYGITEDVLNSTTAVFPWVSYRTHNYFDIDNALRLDIGALKIRSANGDATAKALLCELQGDRLAPDEPLECITRNFPDHTPGQMYLKALVIHWLVLGSNIAGSTNRAELVQKEIELLRHAADGGSSGANFFYVLDAYVNYENTRQVFPQLKRPSLEEAATRLQSALDEGFCPAGIFLASLQTGRGDADYPKIAYFYQLDTPENQAKSALGMQAGLATLKQAADQGCTEAMMMYSMVISKNIPGLSKRDLGQVQTYIATAAFGRTDKIGIYVTMLDDIPSNPDHWDFISGPVKGAP